MVVIREYPEEHYYIFFNQQSGRLIRLEEKGYPEPIWSPRGPELLDISITNWCDKVCHNCYRASTPEGEFMTIKQYENILYQAKEMDVLQIALGGGNPNQHPDFCTFLEKTREYGIVPNYTTNGRGLTEDIINASKKYCGAVALSYYEPIKEFTNSLQALIMGGLKTNIHFVLTKESIIIALDWLKEMPEFLRGVNAIVFLNYKPIGRNKNEGLLLRNSSKVDDFFQTIKTQSFPFKIGFDSCSISGVARYLDVDHNCIESCESGRFSAFISEEFRMYPCSFMLEMSEGIDLRKYTMLDAWQNSPAFKNIRDNNLKENCETCNVYYLCKGGCPIIDEINLC